jgi:hypothetical protein
MTITQESTVTEQTPAFAGARLTRGEFIATQAKILKVNERAIERGFTGRLTVVADRVEEERFDTLTGLTKTEVVYHTRIEGDAPAYGGWQFLARIDRVGESFTIATAPGVDHVDRSLVRTGECDHCGHNRARKNTYLVRNVESGETKNVGTTCIKDFLGWDANVVFFAEGDSALAPEQGGSHFSPEFTLETVLAYAHAATRAFGWVRSGSFSGRSTADWVRMGLGFWKISAKDAADMAKMREFAGEAEAAVAEVISFVLSDNFAGRSTYVENLKAVFEGGIVGVNQIGLVASAPQALVRFKESKVEREAAATVQEAAKASEFVGTVGDKIQFNATITSIRYVESGFGTTVLYTMQGTDGNHYKWFASREALGDKDGIEVHLQGTVKKHDEYRGVKSTVVTRCKQI